MFIFVFKVGNFWKKFWTFCGKFATDLSNLQSLCTEETYMIKYLFVLRVDDLRKIGDFFWQECQSFILIVKMKFKGEIKILEQNRIPQAMIWEIRSKKISFGEFFQSVVKKDTFMSGRNSWWKIIFFWMNYLFFRCLSLFAEINLETWRSCFVQS